MKIEIKKRALSKMVKPMLLNKAEPNLIDFYEQNKYLASRKFDGVRVIAIKEDNKIILLGRSGYTYETKFKEIVKALEFLPDGTILDGELCCDTFQHTQARTLTKNQYKIAELEQLYPATYYVFDCLAMNYEDLVSFSLWERLPYLKIVERRGDMSVLCVENTTNIKELWETAQKRGWEGVCIKDSNSRYEFGKRTNNWLKLKTTKVRIIEFDSYTINNAGIRATNKEELVCQIGGKQSKTFIDLFNKNGKVKVQTEYLEEFESGKLRQLVCKEVLNDL